jgi:hypothetical protein
MALNNITFNLGQGGLGRPLPGEDHISGLIFYTAGSLPSGFSVSNRVKQLFSLADAEAAGIVNTFADETKATGSYLVTAVGSNGDTVELKVAEYLGRTVSLGVYTKVSGDATAANVATAIAAVINAGTNTHGYTATVNTATVTITARPGMGIFLNTGSPLTATYSSGATLAGTITQFTGGAASKYAVWHYHISEYFRLQPQGNLFVGIFAVPSPYTFTEITTVQSFANGKIRQIGIFKDSAAFASADITAIHNVCAANVTAHKELIALYGADISGTADVSTLTDLSALTANYCTAVIAQDGGATGAALFYASGKSVTTLGAALGAVARAKVSHSIAWVAQFNISNGTECDVLAFANGVLFSHSSVTDSLLSTLQDRRFLFLRKFVGIAGSYFNENPTSIALSSDYAYITDNRTMQKATRGIYVAVLPALNSPITLNADGTLSDEAVAYFEGLAEGPLFEMVRNGEMSGFNVTVNTQQNVLSTGILVINVTLVQIATGRNIVINIGYNVTV